MWDLCGQTAKIIDRLLDLAVRLGTLLYVQLHRRAGQATVSPPRNRYDYFQITVELHHGRRGRLRGMLPLRLQKQLRLIQKPLAHRRCCASPGRIQLSRFTAAQPVPGKPLGHASAVVRQRSRHRHQVLHRHMRRDPAVAHLLLHAVGKQLHQTHPARHPTRAAIETASQLLQPIAEALLQFNQQPALFKSRFVIARAHRPVQKQGLHFAQRPDHRLHRVLTQLLQSRYPPIAVDDQVVLWLLGRNHHDRRLLTAGRQRRHQPPLPLWPAHPKVLQAPLKLVEFQPHLPHSLDRSTLRLAESGIARRHAVVSPDLQRNQYDMPATGIAWSAAEVHP